MATSDATEIGHTILIRATPARVYKALTNRDEIAAWQGDPGNLIIHTPSPSSNLSAAWSRHHPEDSAHSQSTEARFHLETLAGATRVTIMHPGEGDDTRDWPEELRYLQAWVESGRSREMLHDPQRFASVERSITLPSSPEWTWKALTDASLISQWLDAEVSCTPELGGPIDILWSDGSHVGGEIVLLDPPYHLITQWWDATSLAGHDDPGVITVMHWRVTPDPAGSIVHLLDTGYDLHRVTDEWMQAINEGWDTFLANLVTLATRYGIRPAP